MFPTLCLSLKPSGLFAITVAASATDHGTPSGHSGIASGAASVPCDSSTSSSETPSATPPSGAESDESALPPLSLGFSDAGGAGAGLRLWYRGRTGCGGGARSPSASRATGDGSFRFSFSEIWNVVNDLERDLFAIGQVEDRRLARRPPKAEAFMHTPSSNAQDAWSLALTQAAQRPDLAQCCAKGISFSH